MVASLLLHDCSEVDFACQYLQVKNKFRYICWLKCKVEGSGCFICDLGIFSLHIPEFFLLLSNPVAPSLWDIDLFHIKVIIAIFPE